MPEVIATVAELTRAGSKEFTHRGRPAIVIATEAGVRAYYNICTHEGGCCTLVGRDLQCSLHGARFNPATGKALSSPAPLDSRLTAIPVRVDGDIISVIDT